MVAALATGDPEQLAPLLGNELQPAALSMKPALRRVLRAGVEAGRAGRHRVGFRADVHISVPLGALGGRRRHRALGGRGVPHGAGGQRPGARRPGGAHADHRGMTDDIEFRATGLALLKRSLRCSTVTNTGQALRLVASPADPPAGVSVPAWPRCARLPRHHRFETKSPPNCGRAAAPQSAVEQGQH